MNNIIPGLQARQDALLAAADVLEGEAYAVNTRRAYDAAWRGFQEWARAMGRSSLPTDVETLRLYLVECSRRYKASTIELHLAAIRKCHQVAGLPLDLAPLAELRRGVRRHVGTARRGKAAIEIDQLVRILGRLGGSLPELRDRVILLLGFVGGLRRSEIAALDVDDLVFEKAGILATLRKSKGDQEGQGAVVELKAAKRAILCPVRAIRDWLAAAEISEGPLLRSIDRFGVISEYRLTDTSVRKIVIARAAAAGIKNVSAHSLRAGAATSALANGAKLERVAAHLRHKSIQTTLVYDRKASRFKDNAMEGLLDADMPDDPLPPVPVVRRDDVQRVEFIDFDERATMSTKPIVAKRLEFTPVDLDALDAAMRETDAASKRAAAKVEEGS